MTDHVEKAQEAIEKAKRKALMHTLKDIHDKLGLAYRYTPELMGNYQDKLLSHIRDCLMLIEEQLPQEEINEVNRERQIRKDIDDEKLIPVINGIHPLGGFTCS